MRGCRESDEGADEAVDLGRVTSKLNGNVVRLEREGGELAHDWRWVREAKEELGRCLPYTRPRGRQS